MTYRFEADMIAPLVRSLPRLLVPEGPYAVACEVPDGARVVDIMYASIPVSQTLSTGERRAASGLARLSTAQTMVLGLIWRERSVSTARLSRLTFIQPERLMREYLSPMEKARLVRLVGRSWVVGSWAELGPTQLMAIEAKLTDWREAIRQATDNRRRADYSYIAMPVADSRRKSMDILRCAKSAGVGVIELDSSGEAQMALAARRTPLAESSGRWQLSLRVMADLLQPDSRWNVLSL